MVDKDFTLQAVRAIAARCDGAETQDGVGFNGQDTMFGKRLAALPDDAVTDEMVGEAAVMVAKYVAQLERYGFDAEAVRDNARDARRNVEARQDARRALQARDKGALKVTVENGQVVARGKGTFANKDWMKAAGARYDGNGGWACPLNRAGALVTGLLAKGFDVPDEAVAQAAEAPAKPSNPKHVVEVRHDRLYGDVVVFEAPFGDPDTEAWRALDGRQWLSAEKHNVAPVSTSTLVFAKFYGFDGIELIEAALEARSEEAKAAEALADANRESSRAAEGEPIEGIETGLDPYPYQWAGVKHVLQNRRVLIGDEMGVGKTATALVALAAAKAYPAVVVVPEIVRGNWVAETERFTPGVTTEIATGTEPYETTADIVIIGYTALRANNSAWARKLAQRGLKAVVADEAHALKNEKAQQTAAVKVLAEAVRGVKASRPATERIARGRQKASVGTGWNF